MEDTLKLGKIDQSEQNKSKTESISLTDDKIMDLIYIAVISLFLIVIAGVWIITS